MAHIHKKEPSAQSKRSLIVGIAGIAAIAFLTYLVFYGFISRESVEGLNEQARNVAESEDLNQIDKTELVFTAAVQSEWNLGPSNTYPVGVQHLDVPSSSMGIDVGVNVYTPPGYPNGGPYPVIYFLHGVNGNEYNYFGYTQYDKSNPDSILQSDNLISLIQNHASNSAIDPAIVVFPNGLRNSSYRDNGDNKPETFIIDELIPYIDQNYNTIGTRSGRSIEGFSMGGGGTMRYLFTYPELFCTAIAYSTSPGPQGTPELFDRIEQNAARVANYGIEYRVVYGGEQDLGLVKEISRDSQPSNLVNTLPKAIADFNNNVGGVNPTGAQVYPFYQEIGTGLVSIDGTGHNFGAQLTAQHSSGMSYAEFNLRHHMDCFRGTNPEPTPTGTPTPTPTGTPTPTPTGTPTPTPTGTRTPTPTPTPTGTQTPTPTPTPTGTPTPTPTGGEVCETKSQGDANCDGVTDIYDRLEFIKEYSNQPNTDLDGDGNSIDCDFDFDGDVDIDDRNILVSNYNSGGGGRSGSRNTPGR